MIEIEVRHCTGSGFLPTAISLFTNSHITHTCVKVNENGEDVIYEMQENGLTRKLEASWKEKYNYKYVTTYHQITPFKYNWLKSKQGVLPYDKGTLIVSQPLLQLFGIWVGRKQKSTRDGMICSELVAFLLGVEKWWLQSPKSLYKLCKDGKL